MIVKIFMAQRAKLFSVFLGCLLLFAVVAKGAYDLWALTAVAVVSLVLAGAALWAFPCFRYVNPWLFLCLLAAFAVSFFQAVNPGESLMTLTGWVSCMLVFWVGLNVFRYKSSLSLLLSFVVLILWIELSVNLYEGITRGAFQTPGTLIDSNIQAAFLLPWIPPLIEQTDRTWPKGGAVRWFWGAGLVAGLLNLIFVQSVWALVCLTAGLVIFVRYRRFAVFSEIHPVLIRILGAAFIGGVIFVLVRKIAYEWFIAIPGGHATSRLEWWASAVKMWQHHPWFGVGLGNYPSAYLAHKIGGGQHTLHAHNFLLQLLGETGLIGVTGIFIFVFFMARTVRAHWDRCRARWPFLVGLLTLFLMGMINLSLEYLANLMVGWLFMAILLAPVAKRSWRARASIKLIVTAAGVAAFPFVVAPFLASQRVVQGQADFRSGRGEEAFLLFSSAAKLDSLSWEAEHGLALTLYQKGLKEKASPPIEEAIQHQERAIDRNKLNGFLWWELGNMLRTLNRAEAARLAFARAVELHPTNEHFKRELSVSDF